MEQFSPVSQVLHSDMGPSDSRETNLEAFPGKQGLSKSCWLPVASPQQVIDLRLDTPTSEAAANSEPKARPNRTIPERNASRLDAN